MGIPALVAVMMLACSPTLSPVGGGAARVGPYELEALNGAGRPLATYFHDGRVYVLGHPGERYTLRVVNHSGRRVEAVAAVDGRDVLDGKPSSVGKSGYLVPAYGEVVIEGFRLNTASVAAFRFGSVRNSYAAQMGDARDVGVVGVAIFPERVPVLAQAPAFPPRFEGERNLEADVAPAPRASPSAPPAAMNGAPAAKRAPSAAGSEALARRESDRPGLGTEFGEERASAVQTVSFERESTQPAVLLSFRYNDREGLRALGIDVDGAFSRVERERRLRESADPFRRDGDYAQPPPGWRRGY